MELKRWIKAGVPFMALLMASPMAQAADLSLQEAINLALAQNTSLKITQKGEDTAKYALEQAKGNNGVSVGLSDSLSTSKTKDADRQDSNSASISGKLPSIAAARIRLISKRPKSAWSRKVLRLSGRRKI